MPLVSVIIPNYNHAKFLRQRIESVLQQSFQDFEVIILDDNSPDNSREIIEEYRDYSKVSQIIYNKTNSGSTFKQWQVGVNAAQGKYIWIAESDDCADLNFLETLVPKLADEEISFVYCRTKMLLDNEFKGIFLWGEKINPTIWGQNRVFESQEFIKNYMQYRNIIPNTSAIIFKKSKFTITSDILQMKYAGDWVTWINLATTGKIAYCSQPLNYFRYHHNTTRTPQNYEKEVSRFKEYFTVIDIASKITYQKFNPFHHHYDWIVTEWFNKYKSFKQLNSLFPPFPFVFLLRFYTYIMLNSVDKATQFRHRLQIRTRMRKILATLFNNKS
jgi:glycosyltransferase involved in cell wall biosynthesis